MPFAEDDTYTPLDLSELPFVVDDLSGREIHRSFWNVTPTGDFAKDCQLGEDYAFKTIKFITKTGFTPLLGWILEEMPRKEQTSQIEFGFFSALAYMALDGKGMQQVMEQ